MDLHPVIPRRWVAIAILTGATYGLVGGILVDQANAPPPAPVLIERGPR